MRMQRTHRRPNQLQHYLPLKTSRCPKWRYLRKCKSPLRKPSPPRNRSVPNSSQFRHNRQLRQLKKRHCRSRHKRLPSHLFQSLPPITAAIIQGHCPAESTNRQRTTRHSTRRTPCLVCIARRGNRFSCATHPDRIILSRCIRRRRLQRATIASSDPSDTTCSNKP